MIPTTEKLSQHSEIQNICHLCSHYNETLEHLFFSCPFARSVWFASNHSPFPPDSFPPSAQQWMLEWTISPPGWDNSQGQWKAISANIIWQIWKARCDKLFMGIIPNPKHTLTTSQIEWDLYKRLSQETHSRLVSNVTTTQKIWNLPPTGTWKINFAGRYVSDSYGGFISLILRRSDGWCRETR